MSIVLRTPPLPATTPHDARPSSVDGLLCHILARGASMHLHAQLMTTCAVLRGRVTAHDDLDHWTLYAGEGLAWQAGALRLQASDDALAVVLAMPVAAPNGTMWQDIAPRALRRAFVRAARGLDAARSLDAVTQAIRFAPEASMLVARIGGRAGAASLRNARRVLRLRHDIQRRHGIGITLDALARRANLSRQHVVRLFRAAFGQSPSAFAAQHAMPKAGDASREAMRRRSPSRWNSASRTTARSVARSSRASAPRHRRRVVRRCRCSARTRRWHRAIRAGSSRRSP